MGSSILALLPCIKLLEWTHFLVVNDALNICGKKMDKKLISLSIPYNLNIIRQTATHYARSAHIFAC